jgi:Uma2 family endonuclease
MPGDFLARKPQWTMEQFHAFRDERPKEEKWELIDGVPMMMPPPTLVHQRSTRNLATLLNARLQAVKPDWQADQEVGIWLQGDEKFNPEPDVTVIDTKIAPDQIYVERFYLVAEVLSKSDKPAVLDAKLTFYQSHDSNRAVLFVRQDRLGAVLHVRSGAAWLKREIEIADEALDVPEIGPIGRLGDLYRFTPLDPYKRT